MSIDYKIFYQTIFETMSDGVMVMDRDFRVTVVNKAWEKITGYSRTDATESRCFEVCAGRYCKASCDIKEAFDTGVAPSDFEISISDKTGKRKNVKIHSIILKDEKEEPIGCVRIFKDLTELRRLQKEMGEIGDFFSIIGKSKKMQKVYELIDNIKDSLLPVIIYGETGTGKEMVCEAIHLASNRSSKSLIKVNLSALPESLIEAELFGFEKGAFTGAITSKIGRFELAHGGSIFLDEISNINETIQSKLLRVIETKIFERIGSAEQKHVDVRIISATNIDLKNAVSEAKFRKDLFYRISAIVINLSPLRERKEDIPLLADYFLNKLNKSDDKIIKISPGALKLLMEYPWPGNVRELKNAIEFAYLIQKNNKELREEDFLEFLDLSKDDEHLTKNEADEKEKISTLLALNKWDIRETASALGIHRVTLWRKMTKLGLTKSIS